MIKGHCYTNLDEYSRARWPEEFVALPSIGNRIEAENGASLKIIAVTHTMVAIRVPLGDSLGSHIVVKEPRIKIELHK